MKNDEASFSTFSSIGSPRTDADPDPAVNLDDDGFSDTSLDYNHTTTPIAPPNTSPLAPSPPDDLKNAKNSSTKWEQNEPSVPTMEEIDAALASPGSSSALAPSPPASSPMVKDGGSRHTLRRSFVYHIVAVRCDTDEAISSASLTERTNLEHLSESSLTARSLSLSSSSSSSSWLAPANLTNVHSHISEVVRFIEVEATFKGTQNSFSSVLRIDDVFLDSTASGDLAWVAGTESQSDETVFFLISVARMEGGGEFHEVFIESCTLKSSGSGASFVEVYTRDYNGVVQPFPFDYTSRVDGVETPIFRRRSVVRGSTSVILKLIVKDSCVAQRELRLLPSSLQPLPLWPTGPSAAASWDGTITSLPTISVSIKELDRITDSAAIPSSMKEWGQKNGPLSMNFGKKKTYPKSFTIKIPSVSVENIPIGEGAKVVLQIFKHTASLGGDIHELLYRSTESKGTSKCDWEMSHCVATMQIGRPSHLIVEILEENSMGHCVFLGSSRISLSAECWIPKLEDEFHDVNHIFTVNHTVPLNPRELSDTHWNTTDLSTLNRHGTLGDLSVSMHFTTGTFFATKEEAEGYSPTPEAEGEEEEEEEEDEAHTPQGHSQNLIAMRPYPPGGEAPQEDSNSEEEADVEPAEHCIYQLNVDVLNATGLTPADAERTTTYVQTKQIYHDNQAKAATAQTAFTPHSTLSHKTADPGEGVAGLTEVFSFNSSASFCLSHAYDLLHNAHHDAAQNGTISIPGNTPSNKNLLPNGLNGNLRFLNSLSQGDGDTAVNTTDAKATQKPTKYLAGLEFSVFDRTNAFLGRGSLYIPKKGVTLGRRCAESIQLQLFGSDDNYGSLSVAYKVVRIALNQVQIRVVRGKQAPSHPRRILTKHIIGDATCPPPWLNTPPGEWNIDLDAERGEDDEDLSIVQPGNCVVVDRLVTAHVSGGGQSGRKQSAVVPLSFRVTPSERPRLYISQWSGQTQLGITEVDLSANSGSCAVGGIPDTPFQRKSSKFDPCQISWDWPIHHRTELEGTKYYGRERFFIGGDEARPGSPVLTKKPHKVEKAVKRSKIEAVIEKASLANQRELSICSDSIRAVSSVLGVCEVSLAPATLGADCGNTQLHSDFVNTPIAVNNLRKKVLAGFNVTLEAEEVGTGASLFKLPLKFSDPVLMAKKNSVEDCSFAPDTASAKFSILLRKDDSIEGDADGHFDEDEDVETAPKMVLSDLPNLLDGAEAVLNLTLTNEVPFPLLIMNAGLWVEGGTPAAIQRVAAPQTFYVTVVEGRDLFTEAGEMLLRESGALLHVECSIGSGKHLRKFSPASTNDAVRPVFNERFDFPIKRSSEALRIEVWCRYVHQGGKGDRFVGLATLDLSGHGRAWVQVVPQTHGGTVGTQLSSNGMILLEWKCIACGPPRAAGVEDIASEHSKPPLSIGYVLRARDSGTHPNVVGHTTVYLKKLNKLMQLGGVTGNGTYESRVCEYQFSTRKWTVQPLGSGVQRQQHTSVFYGNMILSFGGFGLHGYRPLSGNTNANANNSLSPGFLKSTLCYNVATKETQELTTSGSAEDYRAAHTAVMCGHKMVVWGGWEILVRNVVVPGRGAVLHTIERRRDDMVCLDLTDHKWRTVAQGGDIPCARSGHTAVRHAGKMWLFGGTSEAAILPTEEVAPVDEVIEQQDSQSDDDLVCDSPKKVVQKKQRRAAPKKRCIAEGIEYLNCMHAFDFDSKIWCPVDVRGDIPKPREGHTACTVNLAESYANCMFIYGGEHAHGLLNTCYMFVFDSNPLSVSGYWRRIGFDGCSAPSARAGHTMFAMPYRVQRKEEDNRDARRAPVEVKLAVVGGVAGQGAVRRGGVVSAAVHVDDEVDGGQEYVPQSAGKRAPLIGLVLQYEGERVAVPQKTARYEIFLFFFPLQNSTHPTDLENKNAAARRRFHKNRTRTQ